MSDTSRTLVQQGAWQATAALAPAHTLNYAGLVTEPANRLYELLRACRRRARLILFTLIALNAIAFVAIRSVKPRYTAEATVLIGPRQEQVLDLKSVLAGLGGDSEAIESEVQVLRSRKIARSVVQQLHLDAMPEFAPAARSPGIVSVSTDAARAHWNTLADRFKPAWRLEDPEPAASVRVRDPVAIATENFQRRLGVTPRGHSRVVSVTFDSADPELAATIANGVADTYISDQLRAKRDATVSAHRWLEDRVAEMREQVINADQRVAAYRRQTAITQGRTSNLLSEQISTLGEQVVLARITRSNAEARLKSLQSGGGGAGALPEAQASPTIQALRAQESALLAQFADLSRTLGDNHPRVAAARAAAGSVSARIGIETAKVGANLHEELRIARAREAALSTSLVALRQEVDTGTESEVELHALQHEAEANRALYDRLLARSRETNVESGLQKPDAQVISKADAPETPSFPNPIIVLPIFFLASCIATALLVFAIEAMDGGFMTVEQVEATIGGAALGLLPRIKGARRAITGLSNGTSFRGNGATSYAEAVRGLHTSLMLSSTASGERPKVVLVTSALPGEGRSTVVLSLARMMAGCGKRVVVVDCDLHRPDLHRACGGTLGPGLTDCLSQNMPLAEVLQADRSSPALVLTAGTRGTTSPDMFASDAMRALIASLAERFDLVLLDSSPVLAVSETRNLCRLADTTVFVVRWRDTRRGAVVAGLRQVLDAGGRCAGVLLANVDMRQYARHSSTGADQRRIGLYLSE